MARTVLQVVDFTAEGTRVRLSDGSFVTLPHGAQVPSIGAEYEESVVSEPLPVPVIEPEPLPVPDPPPTEPEPPKAPPVEW